MTALDPEVRDLLAAIIDLDNRTRNRPGVDWEHQRSVALAAIGGALIAALDYEVSLMHATAQIRARAGELDPPAEERAR